MHFSSVTQVYVCIKLFIWNIWNNAYIHIKSCKKSYDTVKNVSTSCRHIPRITWVIDFWSFENVFLRDSKAPTHDRNEKILEPTRLIWCYRITARIHFSFRNPFMFFYCASILILLEKCKMTATPKRQNSKMFIPQPSAGDISYLWI